MQKREVLCHTSTPIVYYLEREENGLFVKKIADKEEKEQIRECYILDLDTEEEISYHMVAEFPVCVKTGEKSIEILSDENIEEVKIVRYEGVPHCDILGGRVSLDFEKGKEFEEAVFQFYWKTLIPSVIERTKAIHYPVKDGYVVSTLQEEVYAGTYPDVDHEFQIKGRMAVCSNFDLDVVRRMMELQLKLMREDPTHAYRNPCALQPNGDREYHVRRNSMDRSENAEMFLLTGNIELIESVWLYLSATKDFEWFKKYRKDLEGVLSLVESCMDTYGGLWSDVYYEDQVIKDGKVCIAAAFAAESMRKMSVLEEMAGESVQAQKYLKLAEKLAGALIQNTPEGFWDSEKNRFTDWIDRNAKVHDHIHLLANELPVLFGYATDFQTEHIDALIEANLEEFQRFPSFVSARIQDYTDDEIGDGGPYDLCAAGRYWCWDFEYWVMKKRADILEEQLWKVSQQAKVDNYMMGERYDMNHVYYISEKNWHGAERYYEYPCVFIWNLLHGYLGIKPDLQADFRIEPLLNHDGRVRLDGTNYEVEYAVCGEKLELKNLADKARDFVICWKGKEVRTTLGSDESYYVS